MTWTPDKVEALAKELPEIDACSAFCEGRCKRCPNDAFKDAASALTWALERIDTLSRLDREAATHVETVICMRTHFTGDPPYVGWKGLGLALKEHLDRIEAERDAANTRAGSARNDALEEAAIVADNAVECCGSPIEQWDDDGEGNPVSRGAECCNNPRPKYPNEIAAMIRAHKEAGK